MITSTINKMNKFGTDKVPFFFIINFDLDESYVFALDNLPDYLNFHFDDNHKKTKLPRPYQLAKFPIPYSEYKNSFKEVLQEIEYGNSFLLNLTFPTRIVTNYSLREIFDYAQAKYKVLWDDRFTCFSPETFIKISDGHIHSFPMKGTIEANIPNAAKIILEDVKEEAEHYTIVDLIRNDLAQVATDIEVEKFRYIESIKTNDKELLQVSSHIKGKLSSNWQTKIGTILGTLLPAGSISGAPKLKTLEIIKGAEKDSRNFYTGIAGVFDGENLDSGVMIRYIENVNGQLLYRSGGGITFRSNAEDEYKELINKIYVPIF